MATAARASGSHPWKAEEILALAGDDRFELVDGVPVMVPMASGGHGSVASRLLVAVGTWVIAEQLGEVFDSSTGFILRRDPDVLRGPDVSFVAAARLPTTLGRGFLELAPDLAVEVLSPSNTVAEMNRKLADYFGAGTRLVWIVDPETRSVAVHAAGALPTWLGEADMLDGGAVLPGLAVRVATLFAGLTRAAPTTA